LVKENLWQYFSPNFKINHGNSFAFFSVLSEQ